MQRLAEVTHALLARAQGAEVLSSARHDIGVQLHGHTPRTLPADRDVEEHFGIATAAQSQGGELRRAGTLSQTQALLGGQTRRAGVSAADGRGAQGEAGQTYLVDIQARRTERQRRDCGDSRLRPSTRGTTTNRALPVISRSRRKLLRTRSHRSQEGGSIGRAHAPRSAGAVRIAALGTATRRPRVAAPRRARRVAASQGKASHRHARAQARPEHASGHCSGRRAAARPRGEQLARNGTARWGGGPAPRTCLHAQRDDEERAHSRQVKKRRGFGPRTWSRTFLLSF